MHRVDRATGVDIDLAGDGQLDVESANDTDDHDLYDYRGVRSGGEVPEDPAGRRGLHALSV